MGNFDFEDDWYENLKILGPYLSHYKKIFCYLFFGKIAKFLVIYDSFQAGKSNITKITEKKTANRTIRNYMFQKHCISKFNRNIKLTDSIMDFLRNNFRKTSILSKFHF